MVALRDIKKIKGKVILINPPLLQKSFFAWFVCWLRYLRNEGLFWERQKFTLNPIKFFHELLKCIKLLRINFSDTLDDVSKDKITVIRGREDLFFCDQGTVMFLHLKNIKIIEYKGGHNLCEEMEETMNRLCNLEVLPPS